ncbi:MAG: PD-(D/E)XK nuclease family protein [Bryobacterales bacterium]|nr:PD-(D/E)XK nuclease family protein [Bryobacterales bacterium]
MSTNLFDHATSELSQDAALCWLAQWAEADNGAVNPLLHRLGKAFLERIYTLHGREMPAVSRVQVRRQAEHIDILLVVDGQTAICIEDKRGSREHSGQLQRYRAAVEAMGYSPDRILLVYVQTWDQGSFEDVLRAGFQVVERKDLTGLLDAYKTWGGENAIATDFHDHLCGLDGEFACYRERPPAEWDHFCWMGFYSELRKRMGEGGWFHASNPAGGFYGFAWGMEGQPEGPEPYLQLEHRKLCFKIDARDDADPRRVRAEWAQRIRDAAGAEGLAVRKPDRWGLGKTMTVQIYDGEYLQLDAEGRLDLEATLSVLQSASSVMRRCCGATPPVCS